MDGQNGRETQFPIGCVLFLIAAAFIAFELAFNMPIPWKQANDAPVVSVEYRGTEIVLDTDYQYILVSTYVFSNEGKKPVSFDACYEATASYNGTALKRTYRNDPTVTEANDEIQPGRIVAMQVGHIIDDYIPGKSASVKVKLTERFGELNVIHQTESDASEITVKKENPYCRGC